jgi:tetratricopeptide (TPR) repeat protein
MNNKTAAEFFAEAVRHQAAGAVTLAVECYEEAVRLQLDFAEAYNNLGNLCQQRGEWERAVTCLRRATELKPALAPFHSNLGNALRGRGKLAEAAQSYEQAARLEPDNPDLAYNFGVALHDEGDLDRAIENYHRALRLRPNFAAASNKLAIALKEQGLVDEAVLQFRRTLELAPGHAHAYYNLSELAGVGRYQFTASELERIKGLLASPDCSAVDRSLYAFTLASVLDKQGAYDEAFDYYRIGNELRKRYFEEHGLGFDAQEHKALVTRIIEFYGRSYFERVKKWGTATELPVFIIGMPRSGSTLVEQILASHPKVFGGGEIGEVYHFISQFSDNAGPLTDPHLYRTQFLPNLRAARRMADAYVRSIDQRGQGAARVTIKTLENHLHLGVIATMFARARIIHCRRDALDVCLSCYFQNFQNVAFACSLEDIGAYYRAYEDLMAHWARVLPARIHEVNYEELVHNQEAVTRRLLEYCGLDWDERCLSFWNTRRVVRTASTVQVRKPISTQAIGRWRHYEAHLGPLKKMIASPPPPTPPA